MGFIVLVLVGKKRIIGKFWYLYIIIIIKWLKVLIELKKKNLRKIIVYIELLMYIIEFLL